MEGKADKLSPNGPVNAWHLSWVTGFARDPPIKAVVARAAKSFFDSKHLLRQVLNFPPLHLLRLNQHHAATRLERDCSD
jgi:hypothetical protein